jgi:hypothetical protein
MTTTPPPRRNWHLNRYLLVLANAVPGWNGPRTHAVRSAILKAEALGWSVYYTNPVKEIRKNWKAVFKKETWQDRVTTVWIPTGEAFEQNVSIVLRLNPKWLGIDNAATLRDLSALNNLSGLLGFRLNGCTGGLANVDALANLYALQDVYLAECTGLTNVDGLKNLSALQTVYLPGCTGLTNVDALKSLSALKEVTLSRCTALKSVDSLASLPALQSVWLGGCTGLTPETDAALKAALPKTKIIGP